jgi:hypothetical protein
MIDERIATIELPLSEYDLELFNEVVYNGEIAEWELTAKDTDNKTVSVRFIPDEDEA